MVKEARHWNAKENQVIECRLCSHHCTIKPGKRGICLVRENREAILYTLVYGKIIARHVDPIEKKPLFHFMPGSRSYSLASVGCNFKCSFCQNADISQLVRDNQTIIGEETTPEVVIKEASQAQCESISFTYTEPTIFYEFAYDVAKLAKEHAIKNVFVTNGYMTREALIHLSPYLDAANVDLKAFSERFYRKLCGASLKPVLETITTMKELGIWVEITTLLIPGENDDEKELHAIASFIAALDTSIPWHISRYHPAYQYTRTSSTPPQSIRKAREIGLEHGLRYVYTGNLPGDVGENTLCPNCGKLLIKRYGYTVSHHMTPHGTCSVCGTKIDGVDMGQ